MIENEFWSWYIFMKIIQMYPNYGDFKSNLFKRYLYAPNILFTLLNNTPRIQEYISQVR